MKKLFTIFISITLALCFSTAMADESKLTFSAGAGAMAGALNVAEAKGFFQELGIKGQTTSYRKGKVAFDNYLAGKVNVATCNVINVVLTDFDISKHRIIGTLAYTDNQVKILAKKSAGIKETKDLRGKTIATVKGNAHFYLYKFLILNGISYDEVEILFMKKKELANAISKGEVDAICQHGKPIENAKKKLGEDWVIFQDSSINRTSVQMVMPIERLTKDSEQVKDTLRAVLKADKFIKTDTNESIRIIAKAKGYSLELMSEAVTNEIEYNLSLKQSLLLQLENVEQWAIENNLVKRDTPRNYLEFIDYGPLQEVAPEKVTIIQ